MCFKIKNTYTCTYTYIHTDLALSACKYEYGILHDTVTFDENQGKHIYSQTLIFLQIVDGWVAKLSSDQFGAISKHPRYRYYEGLSLFLPGACRLRSTVYLDFLLVDRFYPRVSKVSYNFIFHPRVAKVSEEFIGLEQI